MQVPGCRVEPYKRSPKVRFAFSVATSQHLEAGDMQPGMEELPGTEADAAGITLTEPAGPFKAVGLRSGLSRVQVTIPKAREAETSNLRSCFLPLQYAPKACSMLPDATSTASGHRTDRGGVSRIRLAPPSCHFSISSDKSRGIFFPWKPESGLFVYLWPQLDWAQRGSLFGEGTGKKNSGDVSSAGGPPARPGQRGGPSTGRSTRLGLKSPQGLPFTPKPSCSQLESNFLIWSHPAYNGSLRSPIPDEY